MRILLTIRQLDERGGAQVLLALAAGFRDLGHDVATISWDPARPNPDQTIDTAALVDQTFYLKGANSLRSVIQFCSIVKSFRPEIILSVGRGTNWRSGLLIPILQVPNKMRLVASEHLWQNPLVDGHSGFKAAIVPLIKLGYRNVDGFVLISEDMVGKYRLAIDGRPSVVINNPLRLFSEGSKSIEDKTRKKNSKNILAIGAHEARKRWPDLLFAFSRLCDKYDEVYLVFVGTGDETQNLIQLCKELRISNKVRFEGSVKDPSEYYSLADIVVLTSELEGYPMVLLEALYFGCQVVSTDCKSGPREIVQGGRYGELVRVGDVLGIEDALISSLGKGRNSNGEAYAKEKFSRDVVASKYVKFFERLLL